MEKYKCPMCNGEAFEELRLCGFCFNREELTIFEFIKGVKTPLYLDFTYSKITILPEGLELMGWLDLYKSKITSLPKGLKVGWWLDIRYTNIKELPKDLQVGGDIIR